MQKLVPWLSWFALIASLGFIAIALGVGERLHPELLAFPIVALALGQVIVTRNNKPQ